MTTLKFTEAVIAQILMRLAEAGSLLLYKMKKVQLADPGLDGDTPEYRALQHVVVRCTTVLEFLLATQKFPDKFPLYPRELFPELAARCLLPCDAKDDYDKAEFEITCCLNAAFALVTGVQLSSSGLLPAGIGCAGRSLLQEFETHANALTLISGQLRLWESEG